MSNARPSLRAAVLVLIALSIIWGYTWVLAKIALRYIGPFDFGALRVALGAGTLLAYLKFTGQPLRPRALEPALVLGLLQTTGFIGLTSWALVSGGAGKTSVLVFTMPFWTLLMAWLMLDERVRGLQWVAVVLALAGLVLVLEPWRMHGSLMANACAVIAGMLWAASAVYMKRHSAEREVDLLSLSAWQMVFGAIPLAAMAWVVPSTPIQWTVTFVVILVFISVMATALGWIMWLYVLKALPAGAAGMSTLAIPVIAVLSAWVQLGERPAPHELQGMLLIGVALAILSWIGVRNHLRESPAMAQE